MIDAAVFPIAEDAVIRALQTRFDGVMVSNVTPSPIPAKLITVGYSGGGVRDWAEASANVGVNVYAQSEHDCRFLTRDVQDFLASVSNDEIEVMQVPAGGGSVVPSQTPPFRRYFAATVWLRGVANFS